MNYKHNPEYCKAFGIHLRKMREAKGFGMREFATHADIEYSQLSKIERGITNPTICTVYAIAEALNVTHGLLYDFKFPVSKSKKED